MGARTYCKPCMHADFILCGKRTASGQLYGMNSMSSSGMVCLARLDPGRLECIFIASMVLVWYALRSVELHVQVYSIGYIQRVECKITCGCRYMLLMPRCLPVARPLSSRI